VGTQWNGQQCVATGAAAGPSGGGGSGGGDGGGGGDGDGGGAPCTGETPTEPPAGCGELQGLIQFIAGGFACGVIVGCYVARGGGKKKGGKQGGMVDDSGLQPDVTENPGSMYAGASAGDVAL